MTYIKNTPLPNPAKVFNFPQPYGFSGLVGHLLATEAASPIIKARQSKNICTVSLSSPREPLTQP